MAEPDHLRLGRPWYDAIEALLTCHDRKAKHYSGTNTDKTVAESIGSGIMPGWVAAIREARFGQSGDNAEIDAIRAAISDMVSRADVVLEAERAAAVKRHTAVLAGAQALEKRINAFCTAFGPKARGV